MELQQMQPPFAGYLACRPDEIGHIYVSPGPIFEPSLASDVSGHGMDLMFAAAGIGPGDLLLNTWSYHLVPAGLLFDQGARAVGATVIPGGTGASELQAEVIIKLGVTGYVGSTAFFMTLIERLEATGHQLPDAWKLKHAFIGGELGDWAAKRRYLEQRYALSTWSCYGTADFGLIGFERRGEAGYHIHRDRYVQICDPETGDSGAARRARRNRSDNTGAGLADDPIRHWRRFQCDRELSGRWRKSHRAAAGQGGRRGKSAGDFCLSGACRKPGAADRRPGTRRVFGDAARRPR